jgi:hypothetical protein
MQWGGGPAAGWWREILSAAPEEPAQQRRRLCLAQPAIDFGPVQAGWLVEQPRAMLHRAALGVWRGIIDAGDAGVGDRARAHRAGFEGDPQVAFLESLLPQTGGGGAIARISAWAVGSVRARGRLWAAAITAPRWTTTAPIGTSPCRAASCACSSASFIGSGRGQRVIAPLA